jgi:CheY-like chemotaxis protein
MAGMHGDGTPKNNAPLGSCTCLPGQQVTAASGRSPGIRRHTCFGHNALRACCGGGSAARHSGGRQATEIVVFYPRVKVTFARNKIMAKRCVFLVDDDSDDREIFAEALGEVDGSLCLCSAIDGLDGLQKLTALSGTDVPKYIFLDLNMPRMNGLELLGELRKLDTYQQVPIIIYTTSGDARQQQQAMTLGASHYMVKPHHFNGLCSGLQDVLQQYAA